eukprot:s3052_g5.t1
MASWTLADIKKEITDLSKLNDRRPNDVIVTKMVAQVERKLESAGAISATTLMELSETIAGTSLADELKSSLQSKVDDLAMSGSNGPLQLVAKAQTLMTIYNYLSVSEFEKVQTAPLPLATQICCSRLKMVGIKSLKEKTKKSTLAFLLHLLQARGEPMPTPAEVYKLSKYVAASFHESQVQPLVPGLATYPGNATQPGSSGSSVQCPTDAIAAASDQPALPAPGPPVEAQATDAIHGKEQSHSLEEYEEQAMQHISKKQTKKPASAKAAMKRPASAKPPPSMKVMKKPSAKSEQSKAKPDTTMAIPKDSTNKKKQMTCWGCSRCRGNVHGCDGCAFLGFKGQRLNGREAWKKWVNKKKRVELLKPAPPCLHCELAATMDDKRYAAYSSFLLGIRILSTLEPMTNKIKIYVKEDGKPEEKVYDTMEWCDQEWMGKMHQEARLY